MIPLLRKLVALVSVILSVIACGHAHAGDNPRTGDALSIPSGRSGLLVTTIRGIACEKRHDACPVYVLTPEEFERDKNSSKCDRKPAGPTLVVITDIGPGTYYVGVQTVIDESVVGTETVTETVEGRPFSLSRKRPACREYLADDFLETMVRVLRSGEPEMVDGQELYPMLSSWVRKWFKAEVKNGRRTPVVAVFLEKTSRPSKWDRFYPKRRTYRITCRSMSDVWDQFDFPGAGEHVVGKLEREIEELLFRGYILQTILSGSNAFWGVLGSALVFGLFHMINPGASLGAFLGISAAGLLLGFAFVRSGSLWLPIGIHLGWNFFEGMFFGFPTSGVTLPALLQLQISGPVLWTGGAFGPEAGLVIIPGLLLGALLVWLYTR